MAASEYVREFHEAFQLDRRPFPPAGLDEIPAKLQLMRHKLLEEEYEELLEAEDEQNIVAFADALADMVYVIFGTALSYGIDLDAILAEVHRSNMTKLDKDGNPLFREDGKVLKSDQYEPPKVAQLLYDQIMEGFARHG